eukprot:scaffold859_cov306-Pinguiococcus_pyrenoidosus.AAC.10
MIIGHSPRKLFTRAIVREAMLHTSGTPVGNFKFRNATSDFNGACAVLRRCCRDEVCRAPPSWRVTLRSAFCGRRCAQERAREKRGKRRICEERHFERL